MFNTKKIFEALSMLENSFEKGEISQRDFELETKKLKPFEEFWMDRHHGFDFFSMAMYGSRIKDAKIPGITLDSRFLLDDIVEYAIIVGGPLRSEVNLFLVISDEKWTFAVNTNHFRNESDKYIAVKKGEGLHLFQTIRPIETDEGFIFQSADLGFRGTILQCLERFELVKLCLPDQMVDGHIRWSKENIKFLHSLIDEPDLHEILNQRIAARA
jgi:hypothetical protein